MRTQTLKPRISQAEIAKIIGVDQSTVSCVLRGKTNVGRGTRDKIIEMCREYNYKPNFFAKSLRSNQSNLIGIITPALVDPFFANLVHFLGSKLEENEYHCTLRFSQDNKAEQREQMLELLDNSAAGVILLGTHPELQEDVNKILGHSIPIIAIGWTQPGTICVAADQFNGGKTAYLHLISRGKRNIAILLGEKPRTKCAKVDGFRAAASEMNMPEPRITCDVALSENETPFTTGHKYARAFLENSGTIDAVFCTSDTFALTLWAECKQRGIRVPEDLAIMGFDDIPFSSYAGLTTIRQPIKEIADAAVTMLVEQIKRYPKYMAESKLLGCELVVRNST